jgi:pimeloyl-ACP methyl ester carboxylesterase
VRARMPAKILALGLAFAFAAPAAARTIGAVAFTPCELGARHGRIEAECAQLEVPEDRAQPAGRRITLQLALVPARSSRPEPDPVVLLAGGPGQAALEAYGEVSAAFDPVRRDRHVLLVDQRGTGRSNPLRCPMPDWKDPAEQTPAALRRQAAECLAMLSERADPRFYTTSEAIADLEAVRAALGQPRFNLVGGSYGTRVALEYLRRHPQAIRSAVLDSVVPPELALLQDHAQNLDAALAQVFEACRADPACRERFGDPAATLRALRARLRREGIAVTVAHPRTHEPSPAVLNEALLAAVVRLYAYQPESAAVLPLLLHEAAQGRPQALVAQAELLSERLGEALAHGMELSVICAEDEPFLAARPEDAGTLIGQSLIELVRAQCALWPRGAVPGDFKRPVVADTPVLLLSGERDPVTPPRYAEQVARTLANSRHLVLRGQGHAVVARGCVPRLLRQFIEAADPEAPDAGCLRALGAMAPFTSYQGPEP